MSEEIKKPVAKKQPQKKTVKTVLKGKKNYPSLGIVKGQPISKEAENACKKVGIALSAVGE